MERGGRHLPTPGTGAAASEIDGPTSRAGNAPSEAYVMPRVVRGPAFKSGSRALSEASSAVKHVHRLGTSLPPGSEAAPCVWGELQVFIPFVHFTKTKASRAPLPSRVAVRVKWWGEQGDGTMYTVKVTQHTTFLTKDPATKANTCLFPVRVDSQLLSAYLSDMGRLTLEVLDADTGSLVGIALFPLVERSPKVQRVPVYRFEAAKRGPHLGDLFVQVLVRMGVQSHLRRVLAAIVGSQKSEDPSPSAVEAVLRGLAPSDAACLTGLAVLMRRQLEGSSASCGFDSPVREERPLVKDAVHAFQLEEAMAYADARDALPAWPAQDNLYTSPESQGQVVEAGSMVPQKKAPTGAGGAPERREASSAAPQATVRGGDLGQAGGGQPTRGKAGDGRGGTRDADDQEVKGAPEVRQAVSTHQDVAPTGPPASGAAAAGPESGSHRPATSDVRGPTAGGEGGGRALTTTTPVMVDHLLERARRLRVDMDRSLAVWAVDNQALVASLNHLTAIPEVPGLGPLSAQSQELPAPPSHAQRQQPRPQEQQHVSDTMPSASRQHDASSDGARVPSVPDAPSAPAVSTPAVSEVPLPGASVSSGQQAEVAFERLAADALWPMIEATELDVSDDEDDLVRGLLRGPDPKTFEAQSKYPTLAAAERQRTELLERVRFLTVAVTGIALLQAYKPPKRAVVRYTLPPHVMAPPFIRLPHVDCPFSATDARRQRQHHTGAYLPETPCESNPLCVAADMSDGVLNAWMDRQLSFQFLVAPSALHPDRRGKPGESDRPVSVATAVLPLRDLILAPYLSIATTLELHPTDKLPQSWKTCEGRSGAPVAGTLNIECSLVASGQGNFSGAPHGPERTAVSLNVHPPSAAEPKKALFAQTPLPSAPSRRPDVQSGASGVHMLLYVGQLVGRRLKPRARRRAFRLRFWDLWAALRPDGQVVNSRAFHELTSSAGPPWCFQHEVTCSITTELHDGVIAALRRTNMVLELWGRSPHEQQHSVNKDDDKLVGLTKVPLARVANEMACGDAWQRSILPSIAASGMQPVVSPFSGQTEAQLEVWLAVGTEAQVKTLRKVRAPLVRLQAIVRGFLCRRKNRLRELKRLGRVLQTVVKARKEQEARHEAQSSIFSHVPERRTAVSDNNHSPPPQPPSPGHQAPSCSDAFQSLLSSPARQPPPAEHGTEDESDSWILNGRFDATIRSQESEPELLVKHVLVIKLAGECPILMGDRSPSSLACYVRYFVRRDPNVSLMGQDALAKNDEVLQAAGPVPGRKGLEQSVCLWWDIENMMLNSQARHILHTTAGERIDDILCGDETELEFQVWLCGLEAEGNPKLIGTAQLPKETIARLTEDDVATRTVRLKLDAAECGEAAVAGLDHVDVMIAYYKEPGTVTRHKLWHSRASQGEQAAGQQEEQSTTASRLLYGESTMVDRLLPAKGKINVQLLEVTGLPPEAENVESLTLEYDMVTGAGQTVHRSHALQGTEGRFSAEISIMINAAFVDFVYNSKLEIRLRDESIANRGGNGDFPDAGLLAVAYVPLTPLLTHLGGVNGVFSWDVGGGGVKLGVYWEHRRRLSGLSEAQASAAGSAKDVSGSRRSGSRAGRSQGEEAQQPQPVQEAQQEEMPSTVESYDAHVVPESGPPSGSDGWSRLPSWNIGRANRGKLTAERGQSPTESSTMPILSPPSSSVCTKASKAGAGTDRPHGVIYVTVEEAKHLKLRATDLSCWRLYVSYEWNGQVITTPAVPASPAPVWDHRAELKVSSPHLPPDAALVLQLWERPTYFASSGVSDVEPLATASDCARLGDKLLGRCVVDLALLRAGMREISGWYHINDELGRLRGQLKVSIRWHPVAPTGDSASPSRVAWCRRVEPLIEYDIRSGEEDSACRRDDGNAETPDEIEIELEAMNLRDSLSLGEGLQLDVDMPASSVPVGWQVESGGGAPSLEALQHLVQGLQNMDKSLLAQFEHGSVRQGDEGRGEEDRREPMARDVQAVIETSTLVPGQQVRYSEPEVPVRGDGDASGTTATGPEEQAVLADQSAEHIPVVTDWGTEVGAEESLMSPEPRQADEPADAPPGSSQRRESHAEAVEQQEASDAPCGSPVTTISVGIQTDEELSPAGELRPDDVSVVDAKGQRTGTVGVQCSLEDVPASSSDHLRPAPAPPAVELMESSAQTSPSLLAAQPPSVHHADEEALPLGVAEQVSSIREGETPEGQDSLEHEEEHAYSNEDFKEDSDDRYHNSSSGLRHRDSRLAPPPAEARDHDVQISISRVLSAQGHASVGSATEESDSDEDEAEVRVASHSDSCSFGFPSCRPQPSPRAQSMLPSPPPLEPVPIGQSKPPDSNSPAASEPPTSSCRDDASAEGWSSTELEPPPPGHRVEGSGQPERASGEESSFSPDIRDRRADSLSPDSLSRDTMFSSVRRSALSSVLRDEGRRSTSTDAFSSVPSPVSAACVQEVVHLELQGALHGAAAAGGGGGRGGLGAASLLTEHPRGLQVHISRPALRPPRPKPRFADSETERIAQIMLGTMGMFDRSSSLPGSLL